MVRSPERPTVPRTLPARRVAATCVALSLLTLICMATWLHAGIPVSAGAALLLGSACGVALGAYRLTDRALLGVERYRERRSRGGGSVVGAPPQRDCMAIAMADSARRGKEMLDRYLVGFELETGRPLWVSDDEICTHGCVFARTGAGKTLWLLSLVLQQMARGRASGCTFIDAKRDTDTLAQIILMAQMTGRIEDLIVIDPFDPVHSYNFVMTAQRPDVKARKVLRAGLPPTGDQSVTKHYDRLAADATYRMVRAVESLGKAWTIRDVAVALSAFQTAYPHLKELLVGAGKRQALIELGHLAAGYRSRTGDLDAPRMADNLRGIAAELHSLASGALGSLFCTPHTDLVLTEAILQGKIIYVMLPRLEEAESSARLVKVFREDLEVSIGEISSSRHLSLEDPHLVIVDEGASTFGPTWANLFELARKGRFALLFGAQSTGGLTDPTMGLSPAFFERVMANVNMKVMMRVGDNRTAAEMSEWIGKVHGSRASFSTGVMSGQTSRLLPAALDVEARRSGGVSRSFTLAEDEIDLVSAEDLKHAMSEEKGLAWFDLGDGRTVRGRTLWFDAVLPPEWDGREHLPRFERREDESLGLADWVDTEILAHEQMGPSAAAPPAAEPPPEPSPLPESGSEPASAPAEPFRANLSRKGSRRARVQIVQAGTANRSTSRKPESE